MQNKGPKGLGGRASNAQVGEDFQREILMKMCLENEEFDTYNSEWGIISYCVEDRIVVLALTLFCYPRHVSNSTFLMTLRNILILCYDCVLNFWSKQLYYVHLSEVKTSLCNPYGGNVVGGAHWKKEWVVVVRCFLEGILDIL